MRKRPRERLEGWIREFRRRLQTDRPGEVWQWVYAHGVPTVLRIPITKYHRITDNVFLGPQHGKLGRHILASAGITASLNMRAGYSDVDHGVGFADYLQLPTKDGTAPTLTQLRQGVEFIRRVVDSGGRVYVHCQTGLGRGPAMAAAFLISEGRSLEEACRIIYSARPFTDIRPSQCEMLREFERESCPTSPASEKPGGKRKEPQELQL